MKEYDIIVIGAGCGGLAAAASAAKEGKKVLLLERHISPGGFATSFRRGRFEFEASLHELCGFGKEGAAGETRQILDTLGISDKLHWTAVPEAFRLITKDRKGEKIDVVMPFGVEEFVDKMEHYVPGSRPSMEKLMRLASKIHDATAYIATVEKYDLKALKTILGEYGNFVRTAPYSVSEVLEALQLPPRAQDIFTAYWSYLGADCEQLGFIHYISMVYSYLTLGSVVPKARSHDLSMALASAFEDNGGEIRYHSHVARIFFENGHAAGVILKTGERIAARHIICNCSPTTAYTKMMKAADVPESARKRTNARVFGARGACVYLGLNRSAEELGITDYSLFLYDTADSKKQFERMKHLDTNNAQVTVCLNVADPACSPKGTCILMMTTLYTDNCWADVPPEDYFRQKDLLAARMIANYEEATGITIHKNIEELEVATPMTYARYTNTPQGVIYGYLATDWDGIVPRIMTEESENDTKGLRFCGGWGTQLSGYSSAIASGRNCAYATLGDMKAETEAEK